MLDRVVRNCGAHAGIKLPMCGTHWSLRGHRPASLFWVELDEKLAQQAVEIAAEHSLRGSDAVYTSVALRFGAALVTLDRQQLERVPSVIEALLPANVP